MRILVLGGDGMLGHRLLSTLMARHTVRVTLRRPLSAYSSNGLFSTENAIGAIDVRDLNAVEQAIKSFAPQAVINAVGVVKQRDMADDPATSIEINALFPHRLASLCARGGVRLVQISTDCVFSGRRGLYRESDTPDPPDLYGRTKLLGEIDDKAHVLTLRTSIVGREIGRRQGLIEWFLDQQGQVMGFTRAIFSGLTTNELARVIDLVLRDHPDLSGIFHVASEPIDKAAFLAYVRDAFGLATDIVPDASVVIDRSLDPTRFTDATGYRAPAWPRMISELVASQP